MADVSAGWATLIATITNLATEDGLQIGVQLSVTCAGYMGDIRIQVSGELQENISFGPGQTRIISFPFLVPSAPSGTFGSITVIVYGGPTQWGPVLASATEFLVMI